MEEAGLQIEPGWEVTGDFTAHGGLTACRRLLAAGVRPTAIFAGSDEMAIGASHAVREAGLRVPEDISMIGIDNHELSEFFDLSTIAQPAPELGRLGARILLDALASDSTPWSQLETDRADPADRAGDDCARSGRGLRFPRLAGETDLSGVASPD